MTALSYYLSSTNNEIIKLKRTFAFWLTIISALIVPLLSFILYLVKHEKMIPAEGENPWENYMFKQIMNAIPFLAPMFIVLITSLIIQIEQKSHGIKHLFSLPIPKWSVYFGKLTIVIFSIITTYIYFFLAILVFGFLLGMFHSELGFLDFQPDYWKCIKMLGMSFIASFGIVGVQFWMSFRFKNFIVPLGIGMIMIIIGLIASRAPETIYFPYAYPVLLFSLGKNVPLIMGVSSITVYSLTCFVAASVLGYIDIKRLNVK
jgi:hypothetical protein